VKRKEVKEIMAIEKIDYQKCKWCGNCVEVCPMDVFRKFGSIPYISYREDCMTCHLCNIYCKSKAIVIGPERAIPVPLPY
jgi:NAD-dependent dihydropyrimidine dehydrogenase PreA subunit